MQIKNKTVLLTGGANGIGFAYAKELLRNGAGVSQEIRIKISLKEFRNIKIN